MFNTHRLPGPTVVLLALLLTACGGGGKAAAPAATPAPSAATLTLGFGIKQLQFSWPAVSGASHYRLMQNPDGVSGFTQVGADLPAASTSTALDIAVHRHDWDHARYLLEACNSTGCTDSNEVNTLGSVLAAIGYVKASNTGAGDSFGFTVALSADGNTLAVGADFEDSRSSGINSTPDESATNAGAVYVYTHTTSGWSQQAYIKASNAGAGDNFGRSVALSGDGNTLAVGARNEGSATTGTNSTPNESASGSGAVYVYTRSGSTWLQQAYVKASNTGAFDSFGNAVALSSDGNTLAVGANLENSSSTGINSTPNELASSAGAVYVYTRSGSIWSQQAYVKASNSGAGDSFGLDVALSGDGNTLAVGATFEDSSATGSNSTPNELAANAGAVYVYTRGGSSWSQQAYVKASNTGAGDKFGSAVTLSQDGNTLAIGADSEDSGTTGTNSTPDESATDAGAVYVYTRSGSTWVQQAYVKTSNTGAGDAFGSSVALSSDGNTLAVGASGEASNTAGINSVPDESALRAGAAYVYTQSAGTWAQQAYVKASNTGASDFFGFSIAVNNDGNTLAIGAFSEASGTTGINSTPDETTPGAGAVYLY
jgi:hypothetical protein